MEDIKEKIDNLRKTLRYHRNRYYNDDGSESEDYEYDMMMRSLQELEEKNIPNMMLPIRPQKKWAARRITVLKALCMRFVWNHFKMPFSDGEIRDFDKKSARCRERAQILR
ncbi:MAG: hypothetical protein L6V88_04735 [Anaerotruncus sp.]|nr:MAG: hypothetical protein L6V88_04735 [Anaerotruncus sp.]